MGTSRSERPGYQSEAFQVDIGERMFKVGNLVVWDENGVTQEGEVIDVDSKDYSGEYPIKVKFSTGKKFNFTKNGERLTYMGVVLNRKILTKLEKALL